MLFSPFGKISSIFPKPSNLGNAYFVYFGSDDSQDRESGPRSADLAFKEMNGKLLPGGEKPIYVNPAMSKKEREQAIRVDSNRFKMSKRRCNLYVRGFPPNTTEQTLGNLFSNFGQIESIKLINT